MVLLILLLTLLNYFVFAYQSAQEALVNEPPKARTLNFSTLVQQILALIYQHGGVTAANAYKLLCSTGPFDSVSKSDFMDLLHSLHANELITQDKTGLLFHGVRGEKLVNHYSFYAAFESDKEFRIIADTRTLGTLPVNSMVAVDDYIIFAGKAWIVKEIDMKSRAIYVSPQTSGRPPTFLSSGGRLHSEVRRTMRKIYEGIDAVPYADTVVMRLIEEGRKTYFTNKLNTENIIQSGASVFLFSWLEIDENIATFKNQNSEIEITKLWEIGMYRLSHHKATKANALKQILKKHDPKSIFCFGDDLMDIGMLDHFYGIAVANALKEVKAVATEITLSNKEEGFAHRVEQLLN